MHSQACTHTGSIASNRRPRYSNMTRYLHTAQNKHANHSQGRSSLNKKPGMPSRAPIQDPYLSLKPMARKPLGRQGTWALMTANTTNWEGAERLFRALGSPGHPSKPTFIVIQEHRKADTQACKQAEDWASGYGYNLSLAPAAHTGTGKLQTSGVWR